MLVLSLLCLVASALATDPGPSYGGDPPSPPSGGYGGPTIEDAKAIISAIQDKVADLAVDLASVRTLGSVNEERLNRINDKTVPALKLRLQQQDEAIQILNDKGKQLQYEADVADADATSIKYRVAATQDAIAAIAGQLNKIEGTNSYQTAYIRWLDFYYYLYKRFLVYYVDYYIQFLSNDLADVYEKVAAVHDFAKDRNCEYGLVALRLRGESASERVDFKTVFPAAPEVLVNYIGFYGAQPVKGYGKPSGYEYDALVLNPFQVSNVDDTGFTVSSTDGSTGNVFLDAIYGSYMACSNLDVDLDLPRYSGLKPSPDAAPDAGEPPVDASD